MRLGEVEARLDGRAPGLLGVQRQYAVLAPLVERGDGLHLLFEVRADTLRRQPGEICFPGGRMEPEEGAVQCALRETWEELGIPPEAVRPVARLDSIHHQGDFLMHPVLGVVEAGAMERIAPAPAEVKEVFLAPLDFFLQNPPIRCGYDLTPQVGEDFPYETVGVSRSYPWRKGHVEVPIYCWQGRVIWGLTARVALHLTQLLD